MDKSWPPSFEAADGASTAQWLHTTSLFPEEYLPKKQKTRVEGRGIQSIEVGSRLLAVLTGAETPLMLRDIAAEAELTPAQAHAYLASFKRIELVEQDRGTGRYLLGPAAIRLAMARFRNSEVMSAANREAKALSQELGLMVTVVVWGPHAPTVVFVHETSESLEVNVRAGTRFSVTQSTCGRIFAAFAARDSVKSRITDELSEIAENPACLASHKGAFEKAVSQTRASGYSWMSDKPVPGLSSMAAPVMAGGGGLDIVMMLIGPNEKLLGERESTPLARLLLVTSRLTELGKTYSSATATK